MKSKCTLTYFPIQLMAALSFCGLPLQAQQAVSSGGWDEPTTWDSSSVPTDNSVARIFDGYSVVKSEKGTSHARVNVGNHAEGGTLILSSGGINAANTMIGAHQVALGPQGRGLIHIDGGHFSTSSEKGGGIQVGVGDYSSGHLRITSGTIVTTSGIHLGIGVDATGKMSIEGGDVYVATGTNSQLNRNDNANFFVGALVKSIHSRNGIFEQTGGSLTVTDGLRDVHYYFSVGNARNIENSPVGVATIKGGTLTANVKVGRDKDLADAGGSGILTVGSRANVRGQSQAWEVGGNGTLEFQLGEGDDFNPVDLTTVTASQAILFTQPGARLQVDGSALPYSGFHDSIKLIEYKSGCGPSPSSLDHLEVDFVGFNSHFSPSLVWNDTALFLKLYR